MKLALFGISEIKVGKHNLKDPRLDQADKLAEADKKTAAQVDVIGEEGLLESDGILAVDDNKADLILKDLEFVETRLGREPQPVEQAALKKIQALLESEKFLFNSGLDAADLQAVAAHSFYTNKPITVATRAELAQPEGLILRAFAEAGYISFLTVGGKENRAWAIRRGVTAWEAAGAIHTDIQKGFIRAEITSFADFVEAGGETQAKRAGKQRLETKQYVMQDYDVVNFRFNKT
jgi:ribosome-binding ATPase YchF (GTP1/OBG family)